MARLKTDIWVYAWCRRVRAAGAFATIARKGAEEAGAVFVIVNRQDGSFDLLGPAPQAAFDDRNPADRLFCGLLSGVPEAEVNGRIDQETRFDSDLWLVEVEDRAGRAFVSVMDEGNGGDTDERFLSRRS